MTMTDEVAGNAGQRALERARREADRAYNDALTTLDRTIVAANAQPKLEADDVARLGTALLEFLQKITAFVETKDRELAAAAEARMAALERPLAAIAELRTQMNVLQRAVQVLAQHAPAHQAPAHQAPAHPHPAPAHPHPAPAHPHPAPAHPHLAPAHPHPAPSTEHLAPDFVYVAFEDQFRGSLEDVAGRLREYVPIFSSAPGNGAVVDLGCGRGELLAALGAAGVKARGVDANAAMTAAARERGLDAVHGDALAFLDAQADNSLRGIAATQVVEHLEPAYLMALIESASRKLGPGAPIVLETINPACWLAFFSSYIRDLTHVRPVHPETLQYLLQANGLTRVEIRYRAPVPDHMKMQTIDLPAALAFASDGTRTPLGAVAHALNVNAVVLNNLMFTHLDYAAIGWRAA